MPPITIVWFFLLLAWLAAILLARRRHGVFAKTAVRLKLRGSRGPQYRTLRMLKYHAGGRGLWRRYDFFTQAGTPAGSYSLTITVKSTSSTNPDQSVVLTLTVKRGRPQQKRKSSLCDETDVGPEPSRSRRPDSRNGPRSRTLVRLAKTNCAPFQFRTSSAPFRFRQFDPDCRAGLPPAGKVPQGDRYSSGSRAVVTVQTSPSVI